MGHHKCKKDCNTCYSISKKDFCQNHTLSRSFVISKPGKYCLVDSISWAPNAPQIIDYYAPIAAIVIDADNVVLDLCHNTLSQSNKVEAVVGIMVKTGHQNVTIVNGTVQNFSYMGIYVQGGQKNIFIGDDDTKLIVKGCGYGSQYTYTDSTGNVFIAPCGLMLAESLFWLPYSNGPINTLQVKNVIITENGNVGIILGNFTDATFDHCSISNNFENRPGAPFDPTVYLNALYHYGHPDLGDIKSSSLKFVNSNFDNNVIDGEDEQLDTFYIGYIIDGLVIDGCTFNRNHGLNGSSSSLIRGTVFAGNSGVLVQNSQYIGNHGSGDFQGIHHSGIGGNGYIINSQGAVYKNIIIADNYSTGLNSAQLRGFENDFMYNSILENLQITNNYFTTQDPTLRGIVIGILFGVNPNIGPNGDTRNEVINNCHISNNMIKGPAAANSFASGIQIASTLDDFYPTHNIVIKNSVIQENSGCLDNAGIRIVSRVPDQIQQVNSLSIDGNTIQSQHNGIILGYTTKSVIQNNNISDVDFGVFLDGTSTCNSINNNYITNAGTGFTDLLNPSNNLFANNKTFSTTNPFDVNYVAGPISTTPGFGLIEGNLSSPINPFPIAAAGPLDNINMKDPYCERVVTSQALLAKVAEINVDDDIVNKRLILKRK